MSREVQVYSNGRWFFPVAYEVADDQSSVVWSNDDDWATSHTEFIWRWVDSQDAQTRCCQPCHHAHDVHDCRHCHDKVSWLCVPFCVPGCEVEEHRHEAKETS